jgi:hypothetical protein
MRYTGGGACVIVSETEGRGSLVLRFSATVMLLLILAVHGASAEAASGAEIPWSFVPASNRVSAHGVVVVPAEIDDRSIALVGTSTDFSPQRAPIATVRSELPTLEPVEQSHGDQAIDGVWSQARWPDSNGVIDVGASMPHESRRNPWQMKGSEAPRGSLELFCGAVMVGGRFPVAIVNAKAIRPGARLGKFTVEAVGYQGVVLSLEGGLYIVPRGRRTQIRGVGD